MFLLSDGSDLQGITRAQNIKYMRYLRLFLKTIAAWPGHMIGDGTFPAYFKCLLDFIAFSSVVGGILYAKFNIERLSFFEMGQNYITIFMSMVCVSRCVLIWNKKYDIIFKVFIEQIHLFNYRHKSDYARKMHLYVHKLSHFFTVYMIVIMFCGMGLFNLIPLMNTINNGGFQIPPPVNVTYEHAVYYALPIDYEHEFKSYMVVAISNLWMSYLASTYFCILDLYLALMMFHLWGHLKILVYNLENFPKPKVDATSDRYRHEMQEVRHGLKEIIDHHNLILNYTGRVSDIFGFAIAVSYAFHQVSGCVLLLECSQMDPKAIMRFGPLTLILLQLLVQMSVIFDLVGSMRDRLINSVYYLPWEDMDTSNRKTVCVVLMQAQRPLGLKALGMVEVGCQTMATVLKTSLSYFAMLRTIAMED